MANETLTDVFSDIADAIRAKGVTGQMTPLQMPQKIADIPSGGETPEAEWKDVNFIDYDGKNLYSYTTAEALALTELPPAPDRTSKGLTFQAWNYTLAQIKANANDTGKCTAGATYTTTDGKTHIKITIQDEYYSNIPLVFRQTVANGVTVNWGDGSADQTYSGTSQQTISHAYAPSAYPATYTITFEVTSGTMSFPSYIMGKSGSESGTNPIRVWTNMIDEVNIGNNVTNIGNNAFDSCYSLASITISNSVTSIERYAFQYCYSLNSVTIPSSVTGLGTYYAFSECYSLASVTIPSSLTSIPSGTFYHCYSLASITIPNSVINLGNQVFESCNSLASITIPNSVTSIVGLFRVCTSLASVTIPIYLTSIGNNAFDSCQSLASITIPNSVTSIGNNAFGMCYGLVKLDCSACSQVPSLAATSALTNTNANLKIIVPDALYDDWIVATNWSAYASQIVKASEA